MATDIETFEAAIAQTVDQGGGTFYPNGDPFTAPSGYAVGIGGIILDPAIVGAFRLRHAFRKVNHDFGGSLVGTWLDGESLYVDAVMYFCAQDRRTAISEGFAHNQLAIYDFETGESITLADLED
jgi:hypothetical protein